MQMLRKLLVGPLVLLMALSPSAFAQEPHAVDPALLATTVHQHVAKQEADRAAIRQALSRPQVQEVATRMGVDLDRVRAAVGTLGGSDLQNVAAAARQVDHAMVGGASTVTISTTTIIIALLALILIIVAVK